MYPQEQAKEGEGGLLRQADSNQRIAELNNAELITPPIVLVGVNRENVTRTPAWQRMRTMMVDPDVHIVVDMQDRLIGSLEALEIIIEMKRTNTRLYHLGGILDPMNLIGQIIGTFTALYSGNELRTIVYRNHGTKEALRKQGIFPSSAGSLPVGIAYLRPKTKGVGGWTCNDKRQTAETIFRLVLVNGVRNWSEVSRRTGIPEGKIPGILRNPIYKGEWVVDKKVAPGPAPLTTSGKTKARMVARSLTRSCGGGFSGGRASRHLLKRRSWRRRFLTSATGTRCSRSSPRRARSALVHAAVRTTQIPVHRFPALLGVWGAVAAGCRHEAACPPEGATPLSLRMPSVEAQGRAMRP